MSDNIPTPVKQRLFTPYQVFMIAVLTFLQFTIILDFMVISPLGPLLLEKLSMKPAQFGTVVSSYAFSACISGLIAAGFADKFDRKKLLLFFYAGFMAGTILCALATSYHFLLIARIVTGLFGGVIGSVSFAIITDLFPMQVRGRVMGYIQSAFAGSQILGLPVGLILASHFAWHAPFWMIAMIGILVGIVIFIYMKPVTAHLQARHDVDPIKHLGKTVSNPRYLFAFGSTTLLATGGFMIMPFSSAFSTHNLGIPFDKLYILYTVTGIFAIVTGPLIGKASDKFGKYSIFVIGSLLSMLMIVIYSNLGVTPLWQLCMISVIMFVGISSRMISSSALMMSIPEMADRGAFMSINSSVQQFAGGIGAFVAGLIVVQRPDGNLEHFNTLGYVVVVTSFLMIIMMYFLNQMVMRIMNERKAAMVLGQPAMTGPQQPAVSPVEHN